jgi:hypothetical protein
MYYGPRGRRVFQDRCLRQQVGRQRLMKLALLLASIAFCTAGFLTLDWFRSAAIRRSAVNVGHFRCGTVDSLRGTAFKPNCFSIMRWGSYRFEFYSNSLGFRDERVRQVPLTESQPRLLMLGNSFTQSEGPWRDSYVGRIAAHFPQYDFLNGGAMGYSPSVYLNVARMVQAKGVDIDEVIVFTGANDVFDEAATYQDVDASGAVTQTQKPLPPRPPGLLSWYRKNFDKLTTHFMLTYSIVQFFERVLVRYGDYNVAAIRPGLPVFDLESDAWTYRSVDPAVWSPLGVEGGVAKAKAKMDLLWQELKPRNIALTLVVYPYAPQLLHDTVDSRDVILWREWCKGKCKRFITLSPAFFAVKNQCPWLQPGCWYLKLFVFGDMHYSTGGNALVADEVIKSLTEVPPVKRSGLRSSRHRGTNKRHPA